MSASSRDDTNNIFTTTDAETDAAYYALLFVYSVSKGYSNNYAHYDCFLSYANDDSGYANTNSDFL